jgi:hypothetical protein
MGGAELLPNAPKRRRSFLQIRRVRQLDLDDRKGVAFGIVHDPGELPVADDVQLPVWISDLSGPELDGFYHTACGPDLDVVPN